MKLALSFLAVILILSVPPGAHSAAGASYFPENAELAGWTPTSSALDLEDAARLSEVENGRLMEAVGFLEYSRRTYVSANEASLSIEIVTLLDSRAAYSLLSLLRTTPIRKGPPGDGWVADAQGLAFAQNQRWIRLRGARTPADALRALALGISRRMGTERKDPPTLLTHLPQNGLDASSLRYYPAAAAYAIHAGNSAPAYFDLSYDMEIAQARYYAQSRTGTLSLLKFPTPELAEEYYAALLLPESAQSQMVYARRVGPLLACLEGNFDPESADKLLKAVRFGYSVRWVEDEGNRAKIIWGIPIGILGAVVNSLIFVGILCVASIVIGALFAVVRFMLRTYASKRSPGAEESSDITQLRLR